ncbi:long-chain fatty acid--CoA ligase [Flavobacteriaceae bacterium]|nr:long-chain fatty acid--CoA ligase [Flavobacteriaceae bacterium]MDB2684988.1 long-chain fatty acid--CoA ligase [Flavobacteriaceae bacterium]
MINKITRVFDCIEYQKNNYPQDKSLVYKDKNNWKSYSSQDFITISNNVSRSLLKLGLKPNDKVAIIVPVNQPKWHFLDIGILQIGAQNVPLYATLSEKDYQYVLNHSDSKYCFIAGDDIYEKVKKVQDKTQLKEVYRIDKQSDIGWESFLKLGKDETSQAKVEELKKSIKPKDLATIIYTSGTTGTPKGVMLSHHNIVENIKATADRLNIEGPGKKTISYLPVSHVFERTAGYYSQMMGFSTYFAESIELLGDNIREVRPSMMAVVPRLLEKIFDKIVDKGSNLTGLKKRLFFWALELGEKYEPYEKNGSWYHFKLKIARKLIFVKWQEALGSNLEFMISGSAPLQPRLIKVFTAAGIPVYEGYGMTESSPGATLNDLRNNSLKIGTVGKPLKGIEIKIADDGEILMKGHCIMQGYYKREDLTSETIKNGYLHSGDIGEIDSEGFLKITDRKKEIFKTSGGKYIAPTVIESQLKKSRFIEQVMVIGEAQKMPAALIQINFEYVNEWLKRKGYKVNNLQDSKELRIRIQQEIDVCNKDFGKWEQIKKFEITKEEWTATSGHLTPTLKIKRKIILEKHKNLYNKIYNL